MSERRKRKRAKQQRRLVQARAAASGRTARKAVMGAAGVGAVAAIVVAVVLLTAGGGGGSPSGGDTGVFLLHADDSREAIANGAALDVGEMSAEVFFSDFPPKLNSGMDVFLKEKASGTPVEDAQVTVLPSMPHPGMTKGSIQIEGAPRQSGHYFASWQLPMRGAWTLGIEIERGGQKAVVDLLAFMG